jgi:hypothetical protein
MTTTTLRRRSAYYGGVNRILGDTIRTATSLPCDRFSDPFGQGIGRALKDIAKYIKEGRFPA